MEQFEKEEETKKQVSFNGFSLSFLFHFYLQSRLFYLF